MLLLIIAYAVLAAAVIAWIVFIVSDSYDRGFTAAIGGLFVLMIATFPVVIQVEYAYATHDRHVADCTVLDKDRGGDSGSYRVYTEECGTLAVTDSWVNDKWNSADTWSAIHVGETQSFEIVGWRNGFFSVFPNILEVK